MVTIKSYGYNHIQTHCLLFFLPSSQACNTIMKYATSIKFIKIANHYQMLTDYVHNIQNIPSNIFKTIFDFHNLFNWYLQWSYFYSYFIFKETKVQNFLEGFSLYSLTLTVIKSSKQENEILGNKYPLESYLLWLIENSSEEFFSTDASIVQLIFFALSIMELQNITFWFENYSNIY